MNTNSTNTHHKPSKSDLLHDAKVVGDAAQSHFGKKPAKYDKGQVAGAAADLLDAAAEYGKLDGKQGIGMYVDKAENYLRKYNGSHSHAAAANPNFTAAHGGAHKKADGGGSADLMKMVGDFLKK